MAYIDIPYIEDLSEQADERNELELELKLYDELVDYELIALFSSFSGGSGSATDPYLISNLSELNDIRNNLNAHYRLVADINMGTSRWTPIGNSQNPFTGTLDGNGFRIYNLVGFDRPNPASPMGIFSVTQDATIKNIRVVASQIITHNDPQNGTIGLLAGNISNTRINNVYAIGTINHVSPGVFSGLTMNTINAGLLIGIASGNSVITNAYTNGEIFGSASAGLGASSSARVGGIVGRLDSSSIIENSESHTNVLARATAASSPTAHCGGIVGENNGIIRNSVATGLVSSTGRLGGAGGIAGSVTSTGTISNCRAMNTSIQITDITGASNRVGRIAGLVSNGILTNNSASTQIPGDWNRKGHDRADGEDFDDGSGTPTPTIPYAITDLSATAGNGQITLNWSHPNNGGSPITDYQYRIRIGTGTWGAWGSLGLGASLPPTWTIGGLTNGISYSFQLRAINVIGVANESNIATATPVASNQGVELILTPRDLDDIANTIIAAFEHCHANNICGCDPLFMSILEIKTYHSRLQSTVAQIIPYVQAFKLIKELAPSTQGVPAYAIQLIVNYSVEQIVGKICVQDVVEAQRVLAQNSIMNLQEISRHLARACRFADLAGRDRTRALLLINMNQQQTRAVRVYTINSPVDVEIRCANNNLMGRIVNNTVDNSIVLNDVFTWVNDGTKNFMVFTDVEHTIRFIGNDLGAMNVQVREYSIVIDNLIDQRAFRNVDIHSGRMLSIQSPRNSALNELRLFGIDENGNRISEINADGTETNLLPQDNNNDGSTNGGSIDDGSTGGGTDGTVGNGSSGGGSTGGNSINDDSNDSRVISNIELDDNNGLTVISELIENPITENIEEYDFEISLLPEVALADTTPIEENFPSIHDNPTARNSALTFIFIAGIILLLIVGTVIFVYIRRRGT